jgi:hypothetical protein
MGVPRTRPSLSLSPPPSLCRGCVNEEGGREGGREGGLPLARAASNGGREREGKSEKLYEDR